MSKARKVFYVEVANPNKPKSDRWRRLPKVYLDASAALAVCSGITRARTRVVSARESVTHTFDVEGYNNRCKNLACGERQPKYPNPWWLDYGTCSREHAVDYYGPEAVD